MITLLPKFQPLPKWKTWENAKSSGPNTQDRRRRQQIPKHKSMFFSPSIPLTPISQIHCYFLPYKQIKLPPCFLQSCAYNFKFRQRKKERKKKKHRFYRVRMFTNSHIIYDYTPKMKAKGRAFWHWNLRAKHDSCVVFLFCCLSFMAGFFFSSSLRSQEVPGVRQRSGRQLNSVEYGFMDHGKTGDDSLSVIPFQVISWRPRAFYFPKFATAEQCQHIINMAKSKLEPSKLALRKGESEHKPQNVRTSMGTFLSVSQDKTGILDAIEEKIAKATKLPRNHYEDFNVLRYELGQKYDSHLDAFPPAQYGPQKSQRVATFLVYLSDVEEGGETTFPFENGLNMDGSYDYKKCIGLKVKPRMGDGFLFYSLFPNNTIDPTSVHGSCPVIKGAKWVVTKWIRDQQDFL